MGPACTAIDNGSVNSMHDSWMPLAGMMRCGTSYRENALLAASAAACIAVLFHVLNHLFIPGDDRPNAGVPGQKKLDAWARPLGGDWRSRSQCRPACSRRPCRDGPTRLVQLREQWSAGLSEISTALGSGQQQWQAPSPALNANTEFYNVATRDCHLDRAFHSDHIHSGHRRQTGLQEDRGNLRQHLPHHGWTFGLTWAVSSSSRGVLTFFPALCLGPIVEHGLTLAVSRMFKSGEAFSKIYTL